MTNPATTETGAAEPFWKSPFVLGMGALVGAAVAANLVMVFFAVTGAPGLVTDDYYLRGKSYTSRTRVDYLAPAGVPLTITGLEGVRVGRPTTVTVSAVDGMVGGLLFAYRPSSADADFSVPLTPDGAGGFAAEVSFPLKGRWDLIVEPTGGDGAPLPSTTRRIGVGE
jgi:nitrogen fixation protein FixH